MNQYRLQTIGKEFNAKAIQALEATLNTAGQQGYRYHSVIEVSQPGCAGIGSPTITYIAVFERTETSNGA